MHQIAVAPRLDREIDNIFGAQRGRMDILHVRQIEQIVDQQPTNMSKAAGGSSQMAIETDIGRRRSI